MFARLVWKLTLFFTKDQELKELISLRLRNHELNLKLMYTSADLSELREEHDHWEIELKRVSKQIGHNLCQIDIPRLLRETIGYTGPYPDTDGISPEEFGDGCIEYQRNVFGVSTLCRKPPE